MELSLRNHGSPGCWLLENNLELYRTIPAQWLLFSCHAMYQKGQEDTCPRKIKQVEEYYTVEKKKE
jgi:hypothetical protein